MEDNKKEAFCPAHEAFKILANKWSLIIIKELSKEKFRFNQIKRKAEGISARELSKRLEVLEEIGAVERKIVSIRPVIIEYGMTQAGEELTCAIESIHEWTVKNKKNIKIKNMF
ncbi:MAG: winged helix-turn-helix transcriptional regulator [bacterium]